MKNLQALGNLSNLGNPSGGGLTYLLYDQYLSDIAAGSLNGTAATPIGGTRTVTDTNNKISISGGVLTFATGEVTNDAIWYPSVARLPGRVLLTDLVATTAGSPVIIFGYDTNQSGGVTDVIRLITGTTITIVANGTSAVSINTYTATAYKMCVVMRANGTFYFIKGGTFTNWTLLWHYNVGSSALFPVFQSGNTVGVFTADNLRIPTATWLPVPSAYDTFTRANGALGSSETTGPDSQTVAAKTWTDTLGTWAIATNVAGASALSGGIAFETLDAGVADVIIDASVTRSAGVAGIVMRYADSSNYIIAYHDGTNAKLDKVVAGVTTNVKSAVATYSAGAILRVIAVGSSFRLFYNNAAVSTVGTISDAALQSTTLHGLYTTDTGNTLDNFLIMPTGTNNEHGTLDRF